MKGSSLMKACLSAFIVTASLISWTSASMAADTAFGKVNLTELQQRSKRVQTAMQGMREIELESKVKLHKLSQEAGDLERKLKENKDPSGAEERTKLETALKTKVDDLKAEREALGAKMSFKRKSVENTLGPEIQDVIASIAKKQGLKAVFSERVFAYSEGVADITEAVIAALDATPASEAPAEAKPADKPKTETGAKPSGAEKKK